MKEKPKNDSVFRAQIAPLEKFDAEGFAHAIKTAVKWLKNEIPLHTTLHMRGITVDKTIGGLTVQVSPSGYGRHAVINISRRPAFKIKDGVCVLLNGFDEDAVETLESAVAEHARIRGTHQGNRWYVLSLVLEVRRPLSFWREYSRKYRSITHADTTTRPANPSMQKIPKGWHFSP